MFMKGSCALAAALVLVAIGTAPAAATAQSEPSAALWIGDSYTIAGEAILTDYALGWVDMEDAEGGTGYVADGHALASSNKPAPDRLRADARRFGASANKVVLDLGRNDVGFPAARVRAAVLATFRKVARLFPKATVVVIAPFLMRSKPTDYLALRTLLGVQARLRGWAFVDPLGEGWINSESAALVDPDGVHPTHWAGYYYLSDHLVPAIRQALRLAHQGRRPS